MRGPTDWAYDSEPEPGCAGRRLFQPRGKVLGGTSSMNAMVGTPATFGAPPPSPGEHTRTVLSEWGVTDDLIANCEAVQTIP